MSIPQVPLAFLPQEVKQALDTIKVGGLFPYPSDDGKLFRNREGLLPKQPESYYQEYTVETPGASSRGARRVVVGSGGETYYTDDHYRSFKEVV